MAGLDEERRLLDKRKAMYDEVFNETDYANGLAELEEERTRIIQDIAALEGATDLASAKKARGTIRAKSRIR